MEEEFYTVKEFAKRLGYSTDRVYEWLRTEKIKATRVTQHSIYRIPKSELERLKGQSSKELSESKAASETRKQEKIKTFDIKAQNEHEQKDYAQEAKRHDVRIFKESDDILDENKLDTLINRLTGELRFYGYEGQMLIDFLKFFDKESNKYIISNLREQCERCHKMMERLSRFINIHHDIIAPNDPRGIKYKLFPGGDAHRFYEELTNDNTRLKAEMKFAEKVDRLANECQATYKEYRSNIRETLFL